MIINGYDYYINGYAPACHKNIVTDKGLYLFDDCAAEYVHLCP